MTSLNDKILSLTPGERVDLYEVDLTALSGPILRLTPNREVVIPPQVLRFTDNDTNTATRFMMTQPFIIPSGRKMVFECYYRATDPAVYPNFGFGSENFVNRLVFRYRPSNMTTVAGASGTSPFTAPHTLRISAAGEYTYMRGMTTSISDDPKYLHVIPAFGNTDAWTQINAVVGSADIALIKIGYIEGGTYIPCMIYMDPSFWKRTSGTNAGSVVAAVDNVQSQILKVPVWGGNTYTPIPIEVSGFERSGTGAFPRPKMRMSNLFNEGSAIAQEYGDLRGATVRRRRVYAEHLDNGPSPDPLASYPADVFKVDRKSLQNNTVIEWELASVLDQQGVGLPSRQVLRDVCPFTYRVWNGTAWEYGGEDGCPYSGAAMFDVNGQPVSSPSEDKCSHKLKTGCRARFGTTGELPFGGFPMVGLLK